MTITEMRDAIEQERIDALKPAPMPDSWIVIAWKLHPKYGYWKMFPDQWLAFDAAKAHAAKLSAAWGERRIVRIPGDAK